MADKEKPSSSSSSKPIPRGLIGRRGDLLNPNARLPSLKSPRDLTLGGTPKKSFKPTIPVRREKPKEESGRPNTTKPNKRSRSSERGDHRGRGRGRGRGKNVIQSHSSIFEDGPSAERMVRRSNTEGYGRLTATEKGDFTASASLAKTLRTMSLKREERDEEDSKRIAELLRDDFVEDLKIFADARNRPVKLPLKVDTVKSEVKPEVTIKQEPEEKPQRIRIKQEPIDSDDDEPSTSQLEDKPKPSTSKLEDKPKSPSEEVNLPVFSKRHEMEGQLLFFQLPDSLPGLPPAEDDDRTNIRKPAEAKKESDKVERTECVLQDLPEGYLGKLQVTKSGKVRLKLGSVLLDVCEGAQCSFLQDLVSVRLDTDPKRMINLGQIQQRIVCSPNLESMLASPS